MCITTLVTIGSSSVKTHPPPAENPICQYQPKLPFEAYCRCSAKQKTEALVTSNHQQPVRAENPCATSTFVSGWAACCLEPKDSATPFSRQAHARPQSERKRDARRADELAALYGRRYYRESTIVSNKLLCSFFPSLGLLFAPVVVTWLSACARANLRILVHIHGRASTCLCTTDLREDTTRSTINTDDSVSNPLARVYARAYARRSASCFHDNPMRARESSRSIRLYTYQWNRKPDKFYSRSKS